MDAERQTLSEVRRRADDGNKAKAARAPGLHHATIYAKIREFGLSV